MLGYKIALKLMVILAAIAFAFLGWQSNAVSAEKIVVKMGHHHAVGGTVDQAANKFRDVLKEKTKGKVEVQVFPGAQLGQEKEAIDGINLGTIDASIVSESLMDTYQPFMALDALPFLFTSWKHVDKSLNGPVGERMAKLMLEKSKIRILRFLMLGFRDMLFVRKRITHLSEMKGLKMRAPEAWAWIRMYQLLGSKPTPITWGEVYTALQNKVVEGMDSPLSMVIDMKFFEVSKHVLLTKSMFSSISLVMNNDFYNRLPDDIKKAVDESAKEAIDYVNWEVSHKAELAAVEKLKKLGLTVDHAKPSREAWEKAVRPQHEEFAKKKGPMAKELLEMTYKLK
ncbi:MAG: TRAP transporter substrate-binding protein [Candidatus Hermodarchaeia archaeon]|jgi:C4-dicarboxylate-binding protein DctP